MELHHANPYHIPPPPEQHHQVTHYQTLGNQTGVLGGGGSTKSSPAISVNTEFSRDSGFASQDHDFEQRDNQPIYEVTYRHSSSDFSFHNEWFLIQKTFIVKESFSSSQDLSYVVQNLESKQKMKEKR